MSSVSTVVVEPSAYHAMLMEAYLNPDKEVCGLLFGQLEPESVRVLGHFPSEVTDPTNLAKAQELVKEIVDSESTEQVKLVGWYHTHAGRGCEPTLSDTFLQDRFQNLLPHFVGLVLTVGETSVHEPVRNDY
uniref:COP9 signalosome complex subunit 5 n=1 Tax=Schistocephalus solidus TaxID=70667 RepID=A0A0X3PZJ7_SCHSO